MGKRLEGSEKEKRDFLYGDEARQFRWGVYTLRVGLVTSGKLTEENVRGMDGDSLAEEYTDKR